MTQHIPLKPFFRSILLGGGLLTLTAALPAQVVVTHGPQIGSSNPITADPPVSHATHQAVYRAAIHQPGLRRLQYQRLSATRRPLTATVRGRRLSSRPTSP